MGLIVELQRRKVFKVGAAYLVVAWLAVQASSIAFPTFEAPLWALRVFILIALLGFPVAVVMAWVFDITPEGVKLDASTSGSKRLFAVAGLLVVLAVGWYFYGQPSFRRGDAATPRNTAAAPVPSIDPHSIAVLPFVNMSADASNQYFSDGISEELLNVLARVDGLSVASRTSSFAYKGRDLGASAIARELKVKFILEGSVRKQGDEVRITAQLIDASDDRHVWSETYDRKLTDIFKIQDEIANVIVTALRGSLVTAKAKAAVVVRADTDNMQAYDLYLKARELFIARSDLPESVRLFERVVALDPKFARGWEGLAAADSVMPSWGFDDRDYTNMAQHAAERALQLDPKLSMPWATLANVEQSRWPVDWARNIALLDRAIAADPKNATVFLWRSIAWINVGFFDRAIADQNRCLALEPNYFNCSRHKALALLYANRTDEAIALFNRDLEHGFVRSRASSFIPTLLQRGDRTGAVLLLNANDSPLRPDQIEMLMTALSTPSASHAQDEAVIGRYLADKKDPLTQNLGPSTAYLWLGDYDRVGATDDGATSTIVAWDRVPASFRNSPGMKQKLKLLGAPTYWRQHGFPPQCHPIGNSDFTCD